jgi:hypothetical protein
LRARTVFFPAQTEKMNKRVLAIAGLGPPRDTVSPDSVSIELVIIVQTDTAFEAVTRKLRPLPNQRAVVEVRLKHDLLLVGMFGRLAAALVRESNPKNSVHSFTRSTLFRVCDAMKPKAFLALGSAQGMWPERQRIGDVAVSRSHWMLVNRADQYGSNLPQPTIQAYLQESNRSDCLLRERFEDWPHSGPAAVLCSNTISLDDVRSLAPDAVVQDSQSSELSYVASRSHEWMSVKGIHGFDRAQARLAAETAAVEVAYAALSK